MVLGSVKRFMQATLLLIIASFKKLLCFLNRKRRHSGSLLPTHVNDKGDSQKTTEVASIGPNGDKHISSEELPEVVSYDEWDSWENSNALPSRSQSEGTSKDPVSQKSNANEFEPANEPDYFLALGLQPTIKKQAKVLVNTQQESGSAKSSRLSFQPESSYNMSNELGEWDDNSATAWDDDDLKLDNEAIRQSRKAELEKRRADHQRRNQEKEAKKLSDKKFMASKLS